MGEDLLDRLQDIYCRAIELPVEQRPAFVTDACGDDPVLRRELESLLDLGGASSDFLETPALTEFTLARALGPPPPHEPGERLGPYQLLARIGEGGMGEVWRARRADAAFDKEVAIKLIRPHGASGPLVERFERERRVLARLEHPDVARLYDGGTSEDGRPYLVMELVDGRPITAHVRESDLDLRSTLRLFIRVCRAVQFAHQNLIVHRDLKPSNILVTREHQPKLLDFGIAKVLAEADDADLTLTEHRVFTPKYASPEQIQGESINVTSDVYSLGVLLYELLTDQSPYVADLSTRELETAVLTLTPTRPSQVATRSPRAGRHARRIAGDLDNIVLMALRKEAGRRYASAEQLAQDLERHLDGRTVLARADTLAYRSGKFVRRNFWSVSAGILILGALTAGLFVSSHSYLEAERARRTATRIRGFLEDTFRSLDPEVARGADTYLLAQILERASGRISAELDGVPGEAARLRLLLGEVYTTLGRYPEAETELESGLARLPETADSALGVELRGALAVLHLADGRPASAVTRLESSLAEYESTFGPADRRTLSCRGNLAVALHAVGRDDEALSAHERTLELRRTHLPVGDPDIAESCVGLATHYFRLGRIDECRALLEEAERSLDPDAPQYATVLNNLGFVVGALDDLEQSERYYQRALELRRRLLPPDHPATLATLNNLAMISSKRGEDAEAVRRFQELVDVRTRVLGPDHADTLLSLSNLAAGLSRVGRADEAFDLQREVHRRRLAALGESHPSTLTSMENLAVAYRLRGDTAEAERLVRRALELRIVRHGPDHPATLNARSALAELLTQIGRSDEALPLATENLARATATLAAEHLDLAYYRVALAQTLVARERWDDAERELQQAAAVLEAKLPADHRYRAFLDRTRVALDEARPGGSAPRTP